VIEILTTEHRLSVRRACRVAGLARAAWYIPPPTPAVRDAAVIEVLQDLVAEHGRWGFRKCYDRLRLDGHRWNHKRVHRVDCALRLNLPRRTRRRVPPRFRQPLVAPTRLNEVWALDFMHDALYGGQRFRTLNVLDEGRCAQRRIGLVYIQPGKPVQNAFIELLPVSGGTVVGGQEVYRDAAYR
jgi:putative transposase